MFLGLGHLQCRPGDVGDLLFLPGLNLPLALICVDGNHVWQVIILIERAHQWRARLLGFRVKPLQLDPLVFLEVAADNPHAQVFHD